MIRNTSGTFRSAWPASCLAISLWCALSSAAWAHRVDVSAHVHDATIHGEAVDADGKPVADARVTVRDAEGHTLGRTTTNAQGEFTFAPRVKTDHHFLIDAGGGHGATCVVAAESLPADLPTTDHDHEANHDQAQEADHDQAAETPAHAHTEPANHAHGAATLDSIDRQLNDLRRQITALERTTRFRDVLGGIGFIFGLAGVTLYLLAGRKRAE